MSKLKHSLCTIHSIMYVHLIMHKTYFVLFTVRTAEHTQTLYFTLNIHNSVRNLNMHKKCFVL